MCIRDSYTIERFQKLKDNLIKLVLKNLNLINQINYHLRNECDLRLHYFLVPANILTIKVEFLKGKKNFLIKKFYLSHSPNKVAQVPRELLLLILKLNS